MFWIESGVAGFDMENNADAEGCASTGDTVLGKL